MRNNRLTTFILEILYFLHVKNADNFFNMPFLTFMLKMLRFRHVERLRLWKFWWHRQFRRLSGSFQQLCIENQWFSNLSNLTDLPSLQRLCICIYVWIWKSEPVKRWEVKYPKHNRTSKQLIQALITYLYLWHKLAGQEVTSEILILENNDGEVSWIWEVFWSWSERWRVSCDGTLIYWRIISSQQTWLLVGLSSFVEICWLSRYQTFTFLSSLGISYSCFDSSHSSLSDLNCPDVSKVV